MKIRKILRAFLLALVMVFTIAPATVLAEGDADALKGWSITLGDDIGVKFYLDSADYTVAATVNGEAVIPTICDNVATVNVAAAQMNDPIVLTVKDADQVIHTGQYSVRQYADTILNGNYDEKAKDMVKQMLNYGAASQTYFNYNTKNLANSGITASNIAMPAENPQVSIIDNLDGINFYGASVVMRNKTAVRFYFQVTGDINSFTFSQGTPVLKDDLYYIEIDGINPQNYADDITLTVNDGALSVTYSPLTYIARKYNHAESSNEMKALVQAMYGYHLEAIEYQAYLENTHADDHIWLEATCIEPKTCDLCAAKEGTVSDHSYEDGRCTVCGLLEVIRTQWDMSKEEDAADWTGYHAKKENEALTTTVTSAGMTVEYQTPGNGWKGIILKDTAINISKLTGKLTFTYSSDMTITSYRIHILTGLGGSLTTNGTADYYTEAVVANITAGNLEAWTQTENEDGSVTVTFDLSSMSYFAEGTALKGLTIVTVTANKTPGTVTYKSIELEPDLEEHDCQADGHIMKEATCYEPKTCSVCGATEGDRLAHTDVNKDHVCDACVSSMVIWHMNDAQDAADWTGYHAKQENEALTTTVTSAGMAVEYQTPGNGWKGIVLEKTLIDISKLTGKLTFTYSSDMAITSYRIHILTNLGGSLTANGTADCYTEAVVADITAGNLETWTQTENEDGSVTVTFDLSSMSYFAEGTALKGLTIVTVTANKTPGTVTYNFIEMETFPEGYNCRISGHTWKDATCTETKICSVCGATDGEIQAIHPANVRVLTLNVAYYDGAYTNDHLTDDVTLLSNMSYTNQDMEVDYSFAERADRLLSLLEYYDPGVFFLNEFNFAWWQEVISDEDAILKALPEYTYVDSRSTGSSRNGEGEKHKDLYNMVFYDQEQFTLLDTGSFVTCQPWSGWYDHCTWAKLVHKETGQTAVYATIHVQTVPSGEQQIERAVKSLQAASTAVEELYKISEGLPIVLGGDFNTTETSRGYRTYEYMVNQAGYKDSRYAAPQTDSSGTARIWGSSLKNNGNRIDYIFVNGASVKKYQVASGSFLKNNTYVKEVTQADLTPGQECSYYDISDHLPVVSDIILKSSRSIAPEEYVNPAGESDVAAAPTGSYTENGGTANKITFNFADALANVGGVNKQGLTASLVANEEYGAVLKLEADSHITAGYISIDYQKLMDAAGLTAVDIFQYGNVKITYLVDNSFTAEGGIAKFSVLRDGEIYPTDQNSFALTTYGEWCTQTISCSDIAADENGLVNALSIHNANGALKGDAVYIAAIEFIK